MHILLCTLALLLCSLSALAQNNHQPQSLSIPYGSGSLSDTALFAVKQKHFALGWHWGATDPSRVINNIMRINNMHGQLKVSETAAVLPDSGTVNFLLMPSDGLKFGNREEGFEYIAAVYDACASEDYSDSLRWSWGFSTRHDSSYATVEDGSKRYVVGTGVPPGTVVLSNVTHKSVLKWNPASEVINDTTRSADQMENSGSRYYLSINLRRMDSTDTAMNNDTVLKVKLLICNC
jgi:hypothetical protein